MIAEDWEKEWERGMLGEDREREWDCGVNPFQSKPTTISPKKRRKKERRRRVRKDKRTHHPINHPNKIPHLCSKL